MNWLYDHLRLLPKYEPVVLCDRLSNREEFPEMRAFTLPGASLARRAWLRLLPGRAWPADAAVVRGYAPALIHSHFGYVAVDDHPLVRALDVPWVVSFYGADAYMLPRQPGWAERFATLFCASNVVLALGPHMAATLTDLGCPPEKVRIHPLGIDTQGLPRVERPLPRGRPLELLFAGTFREKKGVRYVLEGAAAAARAGVRLRLHLVGDSAARQGDEETKHDILQVIRDCDLEEHVRMHSWLPFQELIELATTCDLFLAPSVTAEDGDAEGTPFVIQQMMATGMPVISTRHSDIPFLFGPHEHLLVPERDASAIAERIQLYAADPARLTHDGALLADQIRSEFAARARASALAHIYDEVTAGGIAA